MTRLLVKVYPKGRATQWLHASTAGQRVWISPPRTTLQLPTLRAELARGGRADSVAGVADSVDFSSVLLVAGGTGIAPLWQIMRGAMCGHPALKDLPVTLLYSCRADDVLMASPISRCMASRAGSRAFITLTPAHGTPIYPQIAAPVLPALQDSFKEVAFSSGRISEALLREALADRPLARVVVSGPAAFLESMGTLLRAVGVPMSATVNLKA